MDPITTTSPSNPNKSDSDSQNANNTSSSNQNLPRINNPLDEPLGDEIKIEKSEILSSKSNISVPSLIPAASLPSAPTPPSSPPLPMPPLPTPPRQAPKPLVPPPSPLATPPSFITKPTIPPPAPVTPPMQNSAGTPVPSTFKLPTEEEIAAATPRPTTLSPTPPPPPVKSLAGNKPLPPLKTKKKGSGYGKKILISIVVLLLLVGGVIGAYYAGYEIPYIGKYISQYLDSNKNNFRTKVSRAIAVVEKDQNYNLSGSIKVGKASNSQSETPSFPDVTSTSTTGLSLKNMNFDLSGGHNKQKEASGKATISPTDEKSNIFNLSFEFALDQENLYVRPKGVYFDEDKAWSALKTSELEKSGLSPSLELVDISATLAKFQDGTWLAEELVDIKNTEDKVLATIETNKFQVTSVNLGNTNLKNLQTTIHFAKNGGHPVKISSSGTLADGTDVSIEFYYFNFGEDQNVTIPDKDKIKAVALSDFLNENGFYSSSTNLPIESEAVARDEIRLTDLNAIATALEKYYQDNNIYPISSSVEKTNSSIVLQESLVDGYLAKLPVDPQNPQYWYGYNSDGYTYRLTAVVEYIGNTNALKGATVRYQEIIK